MPRILLHVSKYEKKQMQLYARIQGKSVSEVIKEAVFEKLKNENLFNKIEEQKIKK